MRAASARDRSRPRCSRAPLRASADGRSFVNLPGSPKAVRETIAAVLPAVPPRARPAGRRSCRTAEIRDDVRRGFHLPARHDQRVGLAPRAGAPRPHAPLSPRTGRPAGRHPTYHVGGTSGKGSTATMIAAVLTATGSARDCTRNPHLVDDGAGSDRRRARLRRRVRRADRRDDAGDRTHPPVGRPSVVLRNAARAVAAPLRAKSGSTPPSSRWALGGARRHQRHHARSSRSSPTSGSTTRRSSDDRWKRSLPTRPASRSRAFR